jgi:hypothetical protein
MVASGDSLGLRQISARSILPLLSSRAAVRVLNDLAEILNNRVRAGGGYRRG